VVAVAASVYPGLANEINSIGVGLTTYGTGLSIAVAFGRRENEPERIEV
jgi:hypothetical protein